MTTAASVRQFDRAGWAKQLNQQARVSERFQRPVKALVDQVEWLTERVEEILEAWQIAVDDELSGRLKLAAAQIHRSKTGVPDWRGALELIHD